MLSAAAIVCARNESIHIERCLRDLIVQGIEVVLIDQESTDDTAKLAQAFLGKGLIDIHTMPWNGVFNLTDQLKLKEQIIDNLDHDWVIHVDADEHLHPANEGEGLLAVMERAEAGGYNCLNFNEFVFASLPGEDFHSAEYEQKMRTYYHFRPMHPRLMRAFKRQAGLKNVSNGGHLLAGDCRPYPADQVLRHYIMLSHDHGIKKYIGRIFASEELDRGWHRNRLSITAERLKVRPNKALRTLPTADSRSFHIDSPVTRHFWEW